jgi:glycosyltransferase involved in cell wall biosynthesis
VTRVLLCHQPTEGGVGRHVADLAAGLRERGCDVILVGPSVPRGFTEPACHVQLEFGRSIEPRADAVAVRDLARIIAAEHPDIVHAHSSKAGAIARLAKLAHPRVPVVYTPHGYAFAGYFRRPGQRVLYRELERALAPFADRVVCVCEAESRLARTIGPRRRVRVVHNGIRVPEDAAIDPRVLELSRRGPVIGALTLLRPGKGLETLIDAVPRVLSHDATAQVAIFGEGPEISALRARARRRGVAHAVHFPGRSADPPATLRGFDIFVHPSWAEAFPYVILEAMATGLPIVASAVGGIDEALIDGESGRLVGPRDERSLAQALIDLLAHPTRTAAMGERALHRVSRRFTRAAMIDGLTGVYDELMRPSAGGLPTDDPRSWIVRSRTSRAMARPPTR